MFSEELFALQMWADPQLQEHLLHARNLQKFFEAECADETSPLDLERIAVLSEIPEEGRNLGNRSSQFLEQSVNPLDRGSP